MVDDPHKERLKALEERIDAAKQAQAPAPKKDEHYSLAQHAWRMVVELVAGLGIGFGIGYGLDSLFGTTPILLVVFTLLGFAAGVQTMIRSSREIQAERLKAEASAEREGD
ncbi:AtpZ/AtpI family protein [Dinoroseobacter sp. S76]|uniref:AtpZ/AtpI family protein n=1 Tax=Dinoroseobacter sp. S76 TaxID=3415124 RepID=UPI003C7EB894